MKKTILAVLILALVLILGGLVYFVGNTNPVSEIVESSVVKEESQTKGEFVTEIVAQNLNVPWELVFFPDGSMFFTERNGLIRVIKDGKVEDKPLAEIDVLNMGEAGLLGLALDPDYQNNHYVYAYHTYRGSRGQILNRVIRLTEKNGELENQFVVVDNIPGGGNHDGGRIKFGPDKKLYITTGDAGVSNSSQQRNSLAGKILRINPDGTIPGDNPFNNSPIFSYGHRNPQGLAFHPESGKLFATEHGPLAHDEINLIEKGVNYGWPEVSGFGNNKSFRNPIEESGNSTWAPSGATFYSGDDFPLWKNNLFFAGLRGEGLWRVEISNNGKVENMEKIIDKEFGRIRDVVQNPDGYLYFMTNNRDGRGNPDVNDDKIIRIIPK